MTLEKAIEILEDILRCVKPGDPPDEHDAIRLGIEALKRFQLYRKDIMPPGGDLLRGETKE